jgi:hypothetical protein
MTDQILFDHLAFIDRLKRAGLNDDHARGHVCAWEGALREGLAAALASGRVTLNRRAYIERLKLFPLNMPEEQAFIFADAMCDAAGQAVHAVALRERIDSPELSP